MKRFFLSWKFVIQWSISFRNCRPLPARITPSPVRPFGAHFLVIMCNFTESLSATDAQLNRISIRCIYPSSGHDVGVVYIRRLVGWAPSSPQTSQVGTSWYHAYISFMVQILGKLHRIWVCIWSAVYMNVVPVCSSLAGFGANLGLIQLDGQGSTRDAARDSGSYYMCI